jgi:hypothetical protein
VLEATLPHAQSPATNKELSSVFLNCFISLSPSHFQTAVLLLLLSQHLFRRRRKSAKIAMAKNYKHEQMIALYDHSPQLQSTKSEKIHENMNMEKSFTITREGKFSLSFF